MHLPDIPPGRTAFEWALGGQYLVQRPDSEFSAGGSVIEGRWEKSHDGGAHWDVDFGLTYARASLRPADR